MNVITVTMLIGLFILGLVNEQYGVMQIVMASIAIGAEVYQMLVE